MKRTTVADMAIHPLATHASGSASSYQASSIVPTLPAQQGDGAATRRPPSSYLAQFILRMPKEQRRRLHELALELDISAQELCFTALDEFLRLKGLRSIR